MTYFAFKAKYVLLWVSVVIIAAVLVGYYFLRPIVLEKKSVKQDALYKQKVESDLPEQIVKEEPKEDKKYIKWVEFDVTQAALEQAYRYDLSSYGDENHVKMVELLSYLGAKYGGDFSMFKSKDIVEITKKVNNDTTFYELVKDMKYYSYYREAYGAILDGFVGDFVIDGEKRYGLKVFSPIGGGYGYSHFSDFGVQRSYGYKRKHLGHDLMNGVGTPIIAIESGYIDAVGWNQYGGWRLGIRSFDKKRYYYYAHLRKNHPYSHEYKLGDAVAAGDVIGYMGMTGYSEKENVNNINTPHLHLGLQLIFDESQKDGINQIWVDLYDITNFLSKNQSYVVKEGNELIRKNKFTEPSLNKYMKGE